MPKDNVNSRNEDFSNKRISARVYGNTEIEKDSINGFTGGTARGEFNRFIKSIVPSDPRTGKSILSPPSMDESFDDLVLRSQSLSDAIQDIRSAEGDVFINGRLVPGIFQGFRVSGGVQMEKFKQKKYRKKLVALPEGAQLFQIDKGVKPYSGGGSWILLDDDWSTAIQKAREFIRIITYYQDGVDDLKNLKRVFKIESFLVGADRPFNFSTIKINDYNINMDNQIEGALVADFQFVQFEVVPSEAIKREPESVPNKSDSGTNINELTIDHNPIVDEEIQIPDITV